MNSSPPYRATRSLRASDAERAGAFAGGVGFFRAIAALQAGQAVVAVLIDPVLNELAGAAHQAGDEQGVRQSVRLSCMTDELITTTAELADLCRADTDAECGQHGVDRAIDDEELHAGGGDGWHMPALFQMLVNHSDC